MDTSSRYFRIRRKDIAYFKFIIESHEGMAVVRTLDPGQAIVELMIAPGWEEDVERVLGGLAKEIAIEPLPPFIETRTFSERKVGGGLEGNDA
ncbi:MAG: DUF4911 domain-containing protein [Desulfobacterota bacterium]|nr:DUF4911 domain-containing protein [Thermodesulfobacteriota bacterium]